MEKFNYYFNTKERIDQALQVDINKATIDSILFNLVWYAYYNISNDKQQILDYIDDWMSNRTNIYHLSAYAKEIDSYMKKVPKMPWREINENILIRKSELDYICQFNDLKKEKVLFCYLAVAKFKDISRKIPTHWEDESDSMIFKMAKVPIPASERDYFINNLINQDPKAKIVLNFKNDDMTKRIDYISDDISDPVILQLDESNYHELAFTYLNWKNKGGYKKCKKCGRLFKVSSIPDKSSKSLNAILCKKCSTSYIPKYKNKDELDLGYEPKKIICIDCGKEVYIDNYMNGRSCRCTECQKKFVKKCKRNWWNKRNSQ